MTEENTSTALALPDEGQFRRRIEAINRFQALVRRELKKGHDYGVIPGTKKPTLLKPGAEKITKLMLMADTYEVIRQEDWAKGFFAYEVTCILTSLETGKVFSTGLGSCNSMEANYRWREQARKCPHCEQEAIIKGKAEYGGGWLCFAKKGGCGAKWPDGAQEIEGQRTGRIPNEDIYSQVNTLLKMAKKRALVDAALSAGRLSDLFTQDMEDLVATSTDGAEDEYIADAPTPSSPKSPPQRVQPPLAPAQVAPATSGTERWTGYNLMAWGEKQTSSITLKQMEAIVGMSTGAWLRVPANKDKGYEGYRDEVIAKRGQAAAVLTKVGL